MKRVDSFLIIRANEQVSDNLVENNTIVSYRLFFYIFLMSLIHIYIYTFFLY